MGLVDVTGGAIDDGAGEGLLAGGPGEDAAPSGRVDPGALLDHDDAAGLAGFDRGRAGVLLAGPGAGRELDRGHPARDAGAQGLGTEAAHRGRQLQAIQGVGDGADVERSQPGGDRFIGHGPDPSMRSTGSSIVA